MKSEKYFCCKVKVDVQLTFLEPVPGLKEIDQNQGGTAYGVSELIE